MLWTFISVTNQGEIYGLGTLVNSMAAKHNMGSPVLVNARGSKFLQFSPGWLPCLA